MNKKIDTVGDLLDELSKYNRKTKVVASYYVSVMTDAGTDLGGHEDHQIEKVTDLESRIVLELEY